MQAQAEQRNHGQDLVENVALNPFIFRPDRGVCKGIHLEMIIRDTSGVGLMRSKVRKASVPSGMDASH